MATTVLKFEKDIDILKEKLGNNFSKVFRLFAEDTFKAITDITPVRTGRAKFSFTLSPNQPATRLPAAGEYGGRVAPFPFINYEKVQIIYASSNLFYLEFLDQGTSPKAPDGITGPVLATRKAAAERIIRQVMGKL